MKQDLIRIAGAIGVVLLSLALYVDARGLRCGVCHRSFALFAGARLDPSGRCYRHRLRRIRV